MSKKQNRYYYSFTSPPPLISPISETPSAPPLDEAPDCTSPTNTSSPPAYEDAIRKVDPSMPFSFQQPPAKKSELVGYVRDQSITAFNPSSPSSSTAAFNSEDQHRSSPSTFEDHDLLYSTGNYDNEDQAPLLDGHHDQQQNHQLINLQTQQHQESHPPLPPNYSQYHAQYKANKTGIISRDCHLNHDGEALAQFLQQHNIPPRLKITFYGYRDVIHYKTKQVRDKQGNWKERQQPVTKRVEDFNFDLDCSDAVSPQCLGVYLLPDPKTAQIKTVRQLCDDYVRETNQFKELHLTKVISWDYAKLTQALTTAIRAHGYYHSVDISYELTDHIVTIKTDSKLSKMADHWAVRSFFYITLLFIFTWPYLWYSRKKFGHLTLKSAWKMKSSEHEWYDQHIQQVLGQIRSTPRDTNEPLFV